MNGGARVIGAFVVAIIVAAGGYKARQSGKVRNVPGRSDVVEVDKDDPTLAAATEEAKKRWPEFIAAWNEKKPGRTYAVLVNLRARGLAGEETWIKVDSFNGRVVSGRLMKNSYGKTGKNAGDRVSIEAAEVRDWLYEEEDGTMTGAFTEKALKEMRARQRK